MNVNAVGGWQTLRQEGLDMSTFNNLSPDEQESFHNKAAEYLEQRESKNLNEQAQLKYQVFGVHV